MLPNSKHPWDEMESRPDTDHDDSWIMSYADMITLLFGFFVILYSFSTVDEKKYNSVTADLAKTFKSTDTSESAKGDKEGEADFEEREIRALKMLVSMLKMEGRTDEAMDTIEKAFASGQTDDALTGVMSKLQEQSQVASTVVAASPGETTINLMLPGETLFKPGSSEVNKSAEAALQRIAADLNTLSNITKVEITGHTDSSPSRKTTSFASNFTLSSLRAGAVADLLIRFGLDEKKLVIRGVGNLDPLLPEQDAGGQAIPGNMNQNRRVHITVHRSRE